MIKLVNEQMSDVDSTGLKFYCSRENTKEYIIASLDRVPPLLGMQLEAKASLSTTGDIKILHIFCAKRAGLLCGNKWRIIRA